MPAGLSMKVTGDVKAIERDLRRIRRSLVPRITVRALNRGAAKWRTEVVREAARRFEVKQKQVRSRLAYKRANRKTQTSQIVAGLRMASAAQWRTPAKARAMVPQSFDAKMPSGHEGVFFKAFPKSKARRRFRLSKDKRGNRSFSANNRNPNDLPITEVTINVGPELDRLLLKHQERTGRPAFTKEFERLAAVEFAKRAGG